WPGIASIQVTLDNGTWHMCSGALVGHRWVLTVASCFVGVGNVLNWKVVVGATDLAQPGPGADVFEIKHLLKHKHYDPVTAINNIALLELDQPVECSDYIQLGCVPEPSVRVSELKSCYIAGWRNTADSAPSPRLVLQEAKVRLIDVQLCNSSRWYGGAVHPQDLCAGYPQGGIDTCQGDMGGPLVCKDNVQENFWLVGLASWGRGCTRARRPGIFTSTQHFHSWIHAHAGPSPTG
ncbi:ACRO protein, partial [Calcarius ornatus]|nr:ACRO protein [Calcarius ornatus]